MRVNEIDRKLYFCIYCSAKDRMKEKPGDKPGFSCLTFPALNLTLAGYMFPVFLEEGKRLMVKRI
jgi:hypothetical protein